MNKRVVLLVIIVLIAAVLRLANLSSNPPSLYWDEASLGYNAYAVLTTGHDEHGESFPLTRFIAFGDYKPPGYIYASIPAVAAFGLTEFAIRLPSAVFGTFSVVLVYFLVQELLGGDKKGRSVYIVGLLSAGLLAISPWHIQLSRGAFEGNVAMFFNLIGVYTFLLGVRAKQWWLVVSAVAFVLSFYTFNANRVIAPILVLFLALVHLAKLRTSIPGVAAAIIVGVFLMIPNVSYFQTPESRLRFQEVSIFTNLAPLEVSNERIAREGNSLFARIVHNRRILYAREFARHFLDHFNADYLFFTGDRNPRLSIQEVGQLYVVNAPFLALGLYFLARKRPKAAALLVGWWLIALIPAGFTKETPHSLRTVSVLPVPQIIIAAGLWGTWRALTRYRWAGVFAWAYIVLLAGNVWFYQHNYWQHYARTWSGEWQYGYKQMVQKVTARADDYDHVVVTRSLGRPYIYFLLYQRINPLEYEDLRDAGRDALGLWTVDGFGKYRFDVQETQNLDGHVLVVAQPGQMPAGATVLDDVRRLNGEVVFVIGEI